MKKEKQTITIGQDLKNRRTALDLTQQEVAERTGISRSLLAKTENGTRSLSEEKLQWVNEYFDRLENKDGQIAVLLDYLTIHFFTCDYEKVVEDVMLGFRLDRMIFYEQAPLGYLGRYSLFQYINILISEDNTTKGTLIEFSGMSCLFFANHLKRLGLTWFDFLSSVKDKGGNFTRIDLTLDDLVGLLDLPELAKKSERKEFTSIFRIGDVYHSMDLRGGESHGTTIYLGSRKSKSHYCFYQKNYEQPRKKEIPLEESRVINRYELRFRKEKAEQLAYHLIRKQSLEDVFFLF